MFQSQLWVHPIFTFVAVGGGPTIGPVDFGLEFELFSPPSPWVTLEVPDPCSPGD